MHRTPHKRNLLAGLIISVCFFAFFIIYSIANMRIVLREKAKEDASLASLKVLEVLEDIMDDMQDIESGQRGYIISGKAEYLDPYHRGLADYTKDTQALKAIYARYPERAPIFDQLLALCNRKKSLAVENVRLTKKNNGEAVLSIVHSGQGRLIMDSIRSIIGALDEKDHTILREANEKRLNAARATARVFVGMSLLFVTGLIIVYIRIRRNTRTSENYERQIAYLAGLSEKTSDAIFSTDSTGRIRSWNNGAREMYGFTSEQALGQKPQELLRISPDSAQEEIRNSELRETGHTTGEYGAFRSSAEIVIVQASVSQLKDEKGNPEGLVHIHRDITERKKSENFLQRFNEELARQVEEKTQQLNHIIERLKDGFFSLDEDLRFNFVNESVYEITGIPAKDMIGKKLTDVFPETVSMNFYANLLRSFREQVYINEELYFEPLKKWFVVHIYPSANGLTVFSRDITPVKKAEEKLRSSNERFEMITRTTNDAVWEWNLETGELWGNDTHQHLYGLKPEDPVPSEEVWLTRIHPEDRPGMVHKQARALSSEANVFITEYRFNTVARGYRDIYDRCYIVRNAEGKAERILGSMMDITERKQAELALQQSEEKYRSMIEQASDGIFIMDAGSRYLEINSAACELVGYSQEEMKGMTAVDVLPEGSIPVPQLKKTELEAGHTVILDRTLKRKNGDTIETEVSYKLLSNGNILAIARDITAKKKADQAIRTSEEIRKLIMHAALDAIICTDMQGVITVWTPQAELIFGWTGNEVIGKKLSQSIIPSRFHKAHEAGMKRYRETGQSSVTNRLIEMTAIRKSGQEFPVEMSIIPIRQGESSFFCAYARDITERKEAAEKIMREKELSDSAINSLPGIFYIFDDQRRFLKWNKNFETVSGYSPAELSTITPLHFFAPEDRERAGKTVEEVFRNGEAELEAKFLTKDGRKIPYFFTGRSIYYEGKPCMLGTGIDIAELRKSQQDYASLVNTIDGIVWEVEAASYQLKFVSKQVERLLGYPLSMWANDPQFWANHIHPEDRDRVLEQSRVYAQKKRAYELEYRMTAADGRVLWFRDIVSVIFENEIPIRLRGLMVDITEQKKSQEEINRSNARFQLLSKATSDIVWDWDMLDDTIWWNDNYYSLLGLDKKLEKEPIEEWYNRIHPDDLERVRADVKEGIRSGTSYYSHEYRFKKADGQYLHFLDRTFILWGSGKKPQRMIGSMVNMTPIYEAQRVLAESENRLRTIIQSEPQCIKLLDREGLLLDMNPAGLAMIEADSLGQVRGKNLLSLLEDAFKPGFSRLLDDIYKDRTGSFLFRITGLKGTTRWLETHAVPMKDAAGSITAMLGVTLDVTDKRKAEEELEQSYKSIRKLTGHIQNVREQERGHIAREIHDELGQQLTVLKMDVSWLNKRLGNSDEAIRQKMKALLAMLDETVRSVRRISSELRPSLLDDLGLVAAMEWQLAEFEKRSGIQTRYHGSGEDIKLPESVKTALFRIFQESLTNVARHSHAKSVQVQFEKHEEELVLSIEDNGKGFDRQEVAEKRTLGILGMKERTSMIGGTYEIISNPGKGTMVTVRIPLNQLITTTA